MAARKNRESPQEIERLEAMVETALDSEARARGTYKRIYGVVRTLFDPVVVGKENLPDEPIMMVGNHSMLVLDVLPIAATMYSQCDRFIYGMADRLALSNKIVADFLTARGVVEGDPHTGSALMRAGKDMMVFPGGAHEGNKPVSEIYQLKWQERYGFVRLAAQHGYTILPFASVGAEEFYGRYMEGQELAESRLGKMLSATSDNGFPPDLWPPIPKGLFGTLLPKPQRFYLSLGEPISLAGYKGKVLKKATLSRIRTQVATSIERQIRELLLLRTQQRADQSWMRKFLTT